MIYLAPPPVRSARRRGRPTKSRIFPARQFSTPAEVVPVPCQGDSSPSLGGENIVPPESSAHTVNSQLSADSGPHCVPITTDLVSEPLPIPPNSNSSVSPSRNQLANLANAELLNDAVNTTDIMNSDGVRDSEDLNGEATSLSSLPKPAVAPLSLQRDINTGSGSQEICTDSSSRPVPVSALTLSTHSTTVSPATPGMGRVNVSHLRRENELMRLLENAGGILNIQTKEFYESHTKLLESLAQAGESTSSPVGTKIDKRTAIATIGSLENKGRIKQLKTSITSPTGMNRPACIVYLPQIDQSMLNTFLAELAQTSLHPASQLTQFVKIDKRLEYGTHSPSTCRGILPLQLLELEQSGDNNGDKWTRNSARASQLFGYNEMTIREVLLAERTTMAQFYGFIVGKALRCQRLHLSTIHALEMSDPSPYIVSHDKRIVDLSFFCQDISLELYCSLISPLTYDEELTSIMNTVEGRRTLLRSLPQSLQSTLQLGRSRSRSRLLDIMEILRSLELVTPLQPSTSDSPFITCSANGQQPCKFDVAPTEGWSSSTPMIAPMYWYIHTDGPLRFWVASETRPPFWKTVSVVKHTDALAYWDDLREACNNTNIVSDAQRLLEVLPLRASVSAARSLRRAASWRTDYFLSWHQMQYLKQFIDAASLSTPLQLSDDQEREALLDKICWVTSTPRHAVEHYFSTSREKMLRSVEKIKNRAKRSQKRAEESKQSLAKKAEEARLQREQEWVTLLSNLHPEPLSSTVSVRMERIRLQFLQSGAISDHAKWQREIRAALREADLATSKGLKFQPKRTPHRRTLTQTTVTAAPSEVSIQELIDLQGPPEQYANLSVRRKRNKDDNAGMVKFTF